MDDGNSRKEMQNGEEEGEEIYPGKRIEQWEEVRGIKRQQEDG